MKKLLFLILTLIFVQLFINGQVSADNFNISNQIIKETKAVPMEYGTTILFQCSGITSELAAEITEKAGAKCIYDSNSGGEFYSIKSKECDMDIEIKFMENHGEVDVRTSDAEAYCKIDKILQYELSTKNISSENYQYTKYKVKDNNLDNIYSKVYQILKSSGTSNLNDIAISNGYSITGFTGYGRGIRSAGSFIDINIAILSYESGSYLIIGTPEIMTAY